MPTIMTINSVRFCIYFDDHGKPHCHVIKDDNEAKIELKNGECIAVSGFSKKDVKKLSKLVLEYKEELLEAWRECNEQE